MWMQGLIERVTAAAGYNLEGMQTYPPMTQTPNDRGRSLCQFGGDNVPKIGYNAESCIFRVLDLSLT
jgi:hypothetical protein